MIGMNNLGNNGRLGNQMFQYASLVGIAKNRKFDFRIPKECDLNRGFMMLNSLDKHGFIHGDEIILHDSHEFCEELYQECPDNVTLNGYFQTEKYFKSVENLIREDFQFKKKIEDEVNFYFGKYLEKNPVSIVVRNYNNTFDYPGCEYNHRNIPIQYFYDSIEIMGKDRIYIICSNEIELCKKIFSGDNYIFNDIKAKSEKQFFDLCLASKCKDFIASNSTFSWWAAWLGNGRVIIPTPWYGPGLSKNNVSDLYPDGWEKIEC